MRKAAALSLMLLFMWPRPTASHEMKLEEPDHPLQIVAVFLHPIGSLVHHLFCGRIHPGVSSSDTESEQQACPQAHRPAYNFSPRTKHGATEARETDERESSG